MATAYTQTDLSNIDAAIATGQLRVKYQDKEVTYRSLDEMLKIRAHISKQLGRTATSQRIYPAFDKGLTSYGTDE